MATLTITLPDDLAATVRARVAAGDYPDESAVITDLLRAKAEEAEFSAAWASEIAATVDRLDAGTEPLYAADAVRAYLKQPRDQRTA
jgi:antitoxin ParD1/3/4